MTKYDVHAKEYAWFLEQMEKEPLGELRARIAAYRERMPAGREGRVRAKLKGNMSKTDDYTFSSRGVEKGSDDGER